LEKKVSDYLRNSQALEDYWQRPITGEQLQAEMERMAQNTKQPEVLRELFEALGNDPLAIAECVARPALAERLLTNWYAHDQRFQGELKQRAEADLFAHPTVAQMKQLSGNYSEIELVKPDSAYTEFSCRPEHAVKLRRPDWDATVQNLAAAFNRPGTDRINVRRSSHGAMSPWSPAYQGQSASTQRDGFNISGLNKNSVASAYASLPIGRPSPLQEDEMHYYATAVIEKTPGHLKLATVSWQKEPLESWLATRENQTPEAVGVQPGRYTLPKISVGGGCIDDTWAASALNLPDLRESHTAVWTGSEMIVWGGGVGYPPTSFDTGGRYSPSTETWSRTSTVNAPSARGAHSAVWTGSEMIVWGGGDNSGAALNTGGRYDPSTDSWTATSTINAPAGRGGHSAVWTGTQMIVWGGSDTIGNLNTGGRYNPSTNSWTAMSTTNAPTPRGWHSTVWTGSEMIVWGGYVYNNINQYLNTGGRYNPSTNSWTATSTTNAPTARESHTAVWTGSQMIVWGGDSYQAYQLNTGARYNPNTDSWTITSMTNAPVGRDGHTAIWTGNEMIVWGGYGNLIGLTNTGGRYNPGTDSWTATSTTNAADVRESHTAVWTGSEMIVWGGNGNNSTSGTLDTGGRYNPATNTWIINDPPVPRIYHTGVSTGSEMIVWGGLIANMALSTGARYNPSTDDWTATSTTNAPSPRYVHTAVWTGTEMIVWGGVGEYVLPDIGGRYNPITNSWAATSSTNSPSVRSGHTAVWSGNEMIVWGGSDESGNLLSTGGRYNPELDRWVATSISNAPTARQDHSAVWTGNEMVVWGGCSGYNFDYTCVSFHNDGGRYNPSTDSWTATSIANAPSGRYGHTAIWTGSEMIVWGGFDSVNGSNTGGKYDPNTDSWMATSTANAPSSRYLHTAVWTGDEMIVWGGGGTDVARLNTGGRYRPDTDSWRATSTTGNAPEGRDWHTAVWIGSEMLVWGGISLYSWSDSGGVYCAQSGSPSPTPTASPTPTPTPTPCTGACSPTPRPRPSPPGRPTPPPRLTPPPTPTGSPRPTPAPRP
jgi:N-acetylneuraminic acid mutarotase